MWCIRFHDGTLVVEGGNLEQLPPGFVMDDRIGHPAVPPGSTRRR